MGTSEFIEFIRLVVNGDPDEVLRRLADPRLATAAAEIGASRQNVSEGPRSILRSSKITTNPKPLDQVRDLIRTRHVSCSKKKWYL